MTSVIVKQEDGLEPPLEIICEHISAVARAGRAIANSKMKQKAIIILLQHSTGLSQSAVKRVLDALPALEKEYLK